MKRILWLLPLLLLFALPAKAQNGNTVTIRFAGAPTGTCNLFMYGVNNATGDLYDCKSGAWFKIGPATGSGFCTPPGVNHSILIDDGAGDCGDLASLGSTTTVLHGNAAGDPTFSAVVSADMNITTTGCSNQFVTAISSGAVGTCTTDTLASAQHANQGTTTTVLHGNAAGNPSWAAVGSSDLNITPTTCSNTFVTAISSAVAGTCTAATLASAQFANQGTTTTLLHGNAAGNPSFAAVNLASAEVTGQLPIGNVGSAGLSGTSPIAISAAGAISCSTCTVGSLAFSGIASGTNTTAAMVLGTGSSLTVSGSGTNNATTLNGATFAAPGTIGGGTPAAATFTTLTANTSLVINGGTALTTTNQSGSVSLCMTTSCVMTTPTLGVASATSINKVAITAPASSATLTIADGKTLTASNSITLAGTDSTTMTFPSVSATITRTVASGTSALGTSAISSGACATVVTTAATGTATTDNIMADFNADPTSTTGYSASANGMLTIIKYPTADNVNFKVCNNTASSVTPGAATLNWRVVR